MRALVLLLALLACTMAVAIDAEQAFDDPQLQARYDRLNHELRCLQCRSETIADSNAMLAGDLRRQVREQIAAGKSDAEILTYMTERYSDYVLYKPPVTARTLLLWGAPVLLLVAGIATACIVIARKAHLPDTDPTDPGLGAS